MASIKEWAEEDRPREKLMQKGQEALSNSELIAILINNGSKDKSAVELSKELLSKCDNDLIRLGKLTYQEICKLGVKGIGPAKAICIAAALELGIRRDNSEKKKEVVSSSKDAALFLQSKLQHKNHEQFVVLFLNQRNKIIKYEVVSEGGITGTVVDIRLILKSALAHNAVGIILCHNHPSGNLKPSSADIQTTKKVKDAAEILELKIFDHIIVSNEGYYSFADEGML